MRTISMMLLGTLLIFPFTSINLLTAQCAKCVKIEAEREEEKARNPKPQSEYYEDQLSFNENLTPKRMQDSDSNLNSNANGMQSSNLNPTNNIYPPSLIYSILESKDVIETLKKPFTIFVPSNEALRQIPVQYLQAVLNPERSEQLNQLVRNHIVAKKISKDDINDQLVTVQSINNFPITLKKVNGELTVNGHKIVRADQLGDDGMIYVVDQVLIKQ